MLSNAAMQTGHVYMSQTRTSEQFWFLTSFKGKLSYNVELYDSINITYNQSYCINRYIF